MLLEPFTPPAEMGRHKVHRNNLPGGSLDAHQVWACHNQAVYISLAQGARSQYCSPHTSLMAICGHYGLPMSHPRAPECSLCSFRAAAVGFSETLLLPPPLLLLLLLTVAAVIDVYSLILPPQTHHTDPTACPQSCKVLFICQQDGWDTRKTRTHQIWTL